MKKSNSILILLAFLFIYIFTQDGIELIIHKLVFYFFTGVYYIVKQLEENKTKL
jgi:hypothetical protein